MWLGIMLTFFGICGVLGTTAAGMALFKSTKNKTMLDMMALSNSELQRTVMWERTECDRKLAEVKGEVQFLKEGIVESMAATIAVAVIDHLSTSVQAMRRETDVQTNTHVTEVNHPHG